MAVVFDHGTGRLRLDQPAFDRLVAWSRGDEAAGPELSALRDAGVAPAHPRLAGGLRAVREPVCRLRLAHTDAHGREKAGDGWVRGDAAALLLDLPDGSRDFLTVHPALLPAAIARAVRLGPRPRPGPAPLRLGADLGGRGPVRSWRAEMRWTGPGGHPVGRTVHVADVEAGLFLVERDEAGATLWPTTASTVWRQLIRLLPDTDELGAG